jgi:hypothetical protein
MLKRVFGHFAFLEPAPLAHPSIDRNGQSAVLDLKNS